MMVGQERRTLLLHPKRRIPRRSTLEKTYVATAIGEDQGQKRVGLNRRKGEGRRRQKGIVP